MVESRLSISLPPGARHAAKNTRNCWLWRRSGVTLDGIAYKDKPEELRRFRYTLGNPYRHVGIDRSGTTAIDFGVYGVPETYVIDSSGRIRYRHVGPLTPNDLSAKILPLIEQLTAQGVAPATPKKPG